jgi:hypothetical protein
MILHLRRKFYCFQSISNSKEPQVEELFTNKRKIRMKQGKNYALKFKPKIGKNKHI